jgi:hypothetical protein
MKKQTISPNAVTYLPGLYTKPGHDVKLCTAVR